MRRRDGIAPANAFALFVPALTVPFAFHAVHVAAKG